jgi:drug/metabolite transporter (DMT)-like permease
LRSLAQAALLWTGVVTTAGTVLLETLSLSSLSASEATLLFSTEPLWGSAVAFAAMGEVLAPQGFGGAAMILAACA